MTKLTAAGRIRKLRQTCGMTQIELAQRVHVSRSSVQSWEGGQTYPSIDSCIALAGLFHVSIDYLVAESRHKVVSLAACSDVEREMVAEMLTMFENHVPIHGDLCLAGRVCLHDL